MIPVQIWFILVAYKPAIHYSAISFFFFLFFIFTNTAHGSHFMLKS